MATNPMQRRARMSFLLGMFVTLLISGIVIVFLALQLKNKDEKEKQLAATMTKVFVLNQDVNSGDVITQDMLSSQEVSRNFVPSNATSDITIFQDYALKDKAGNDVYTKADGKTNKLMIKKDNKDYEISKEEDTGEYYITNNSGEKEYIQLTSAALIAKVDMKKNTVITTALIDKSDNPTTDDLRKQEYNMIVMPMDLTTGDYVDIRLMLPSGQDYIVVSKKEVELPIVDGIESADTMWMNMREDEVLTLSNAIVEAYKIRGAKLYAAKYVEAGIQEMAQPNYVPNAEVTKLINNNPNIIATAMTELEKRYNNYNKGLRNDELNKAVEEAGAEGQSNVQTGMQESITSTKTTRKQYLDSLSTGDTTTSSSSK